MLSAFSCGRSTCLVFDSGHSSTYAVPVHDGYALQKSLMRTDIAGDYITNLVKEKIESKKIDISHISKTKTYGFQSEMLPIAQSQSQKQEANVGSVQNISIK